MIVGDLLRLEDLRLGLAWGTPELLNRPVTGVTSTDLQDPARYLQPGELVLSGLVWWKPDADQPDADQPGAEGPGAERPGSQRPGLERSGSEQSGAEQSGLEQSGSGRPGSEQSGPGRTGRGSDADPATAAAVPDAALRFATSLSSARVAALLAGEGTHGRVPPSLVDACRIHGIPLISVPAGTSFRAVTDQIYLRLWGELSSRSERAWALPEAARQELSALLEAGAPLDRVLSRAVTRLGLPACAVLAGSGRLIAASSTAASVPSSAAPSAPSSAPRSSAASSAARSAAPSPRSSSAPSAPTFAAPTAAASSGPLPVADAGVPIGPPEAAPFGGWRLTGAAAASQALAELLAPLRLSARSRDSERRRSAADLFDLLAAAGTADPGDFAHALAACALPGDTPLTTVSARVDRAPALWAVEGLTELLRLAGVRFVAGSDERGDAAAVVAGPLPDLRPLLPGLQTLLGPGQVLRIGVGPGAAATVPGLRGSLIGARYALASADPYADAARLDSLAALLAGIPAEVTSAFHERLLGRLLANDRENGVSLLDTLAAFLEHDGSWSRTAKALHVHVNTVHYRARRIEELTGRSLVRLADQADLRAALLCAPAIARS